MRRRQFLCTSGVAVGIGLAGCSAFSTETLTPSTEDGERTVWLHYDDDEHIATVSLHAEWRDDSHELHYPLQIHLWKENGLDAKSLRYEYRATDIGHADAPPTLYLERFSGPREPVEFSRNDDGDVTVLAIPDLGSLGRGSVTTNLLVENRNDEPFELSVDIEVILDGGRLSTDYELTGTAAVEIPARW